MRQADNATNEGTQTAGWKTYGPHSATRPPAVPNVAALTISSTDLIAER